jgi:hypothetical protein
MRLRFDGRSLPLTLHPPSIPLPPSTAPPPAPPCRCFDAPPLGHWREQARFAADNTSHDAAPLLVWIHESCSPQAFVAHRGAELSHAEHGSSSSSVLYGKRILFAGASFAIRLLRRAFHVAGYRHTHVMFTRHVTSNVSIDRFHVEWVEWRGMRDAASSTSSSSAAAAESITFGYTPVRGLFTRSWMQSRDHRLPVDADVIVADPGLHDVASSTLKQFRDNIPAFFGALASVTRHVVLLLPTATHFDMQGVLAYHRCAWHQTPVPLHILKKTKPSSLFFVPSASTAWPQLGSCCCRTCRLQPLRSSTFA